MGTSGQIGLPLVPTFPLGTKQWERDEMPDFIGLFPLFPLFPSKNSNFPQNRSKSNGKLQ